MKPAALARAGSARGPLVLINRRHPLAAEPPALTAAAPGVLLERRAAACLRACIRAVGGGAEIVPVSGWRSRQEQQRIWDDALRDHGPGFTRQYVALPGCSEHESGLAVDLGRAAAEIDFLRPDFPDDGACGAFRRAAAGFGFVQRYRREKETVTGIAEEPWHFRYVGVPHALLLERRGLCLEEYRDFLRERPRSVALADGRRATVFSVPCAGDEAALPPPCRAGRWEASGDNAGGFIVTVWEAAP